MFLAAIEALRGAVQRNPEIFVSDDQVKEIAALLPTMELRSYWRECGFFGSASSSRSTVVRPPKPLSNQQFGKHRSEEK